MSATGEVGGGQTTIADGAEVIIASTASDGADTNTASTVAGGTDVSVVSYQDAEADPGTSASAGQDSLILGGAGSTSIYRDEVESDNGDSAKTGNVAAAGTGILVIDTSQGGIAADDVAAAGQDSTGGRVHLSRRSSSAKSEDGDRASTKDVAWNGGGIVTTQGAVAGEGSFRTCRS